VKSAVKFINNFEKTCAEIAISNSYDFVLCGHIHHPEIKEIVTEEGRVNYLNSGDWIENLTALEYHKGTWRMFHYNEKDFEDTVHEQEEKIETMNNEQIFNSMLSEFAITTATEKK
jgi:predicted phosphodiesterase